MRYDPARRNRKSIRLKGYDYSQAGFYFVTICCYQRQCLFGEIVDGVMQLNQYGEIVKKEWTRSPLIRQEIKLDKYVVMPNHFHGIVIIHPVGANGETLSVGGFPDLRKVSNPKDCSPLAIMKQI